MIRQEQAPLPVERNSRENKITSTHKKLVSVYLAEINHK